MAQVARRRFPYAPGVLGWVGGGFLMGGFLGELTAIVLFIWLGLPLAASAVFLVSLGLFGGAVVIWRLAWKRAGVVNPDTLTAEQRTQAMRDGIIIMLTSAVPFVVFVYLFWRLQGSTEHRFVLAAIPVLMGLPITLAFTNRLSKRINRPPRRFLGLPGRYSLLAEVALSLLAAAGLLYAGLFVIPK